jgi:hypothetical protein
MPTPVRYSPDVEQPEDDERDTFASIIEAMRGESRTTRERYGKAVRTSHAKAHALVRGTLEVRPDLPPELAQGLFAEAKTYDVIVRMAHVPGECLDDNKVSCPRGMAIKIFDVDGEMLPSNGGEHTQDLLLDSGAVSFPSPGPKAFLATIKQLEMATPAPEAVKSAVSFGSRGINAIFKAFGSNSPNMDFFGHTPQHPLAERYYSQTPFRYGDYIAKFAILPVASGLRAQDGEKLDVSGDPDALRHDVVGWLRNHDAEYDLCVQLCTDLETMPIENALTTWSEEDSPYRPVARLRIPAQDAYANASLEEGLSFAPTHSLVAHRPLGGINRARLAAYDVMSIERRQTNGARTAEPADIDELAMPEPA